MAPRGHGDPGVSCCLVTVREKRRGYLRDVDFRGAEQTELGSSLSFTRQQAAIENFGGIEIVRQNFGFDIENGVTQVELDMKEPHYYLEVRNDSEQSKELFPVIILPERRGAAI